MLIDIEMDAIHAARHGHTTSIEEETSQGRADLAIRLRKTRTSQFRALKLRRDRALRRSNRRRTQDQNRRDWHPGLDWRRSDGIHQRGHSLRRRPGIIVRVRELEIISS